MKLAGAVILAVLIADAASASMTCPVPTVLPILERSYDTCRRSGRGCGLFLEAFVELIPRYDCQRSFDTSPVPAIWLAGDRQLERYVSLVAHLRTRSARRLFGSAEFRSVLDGDLAEQFSDQSRAAERRLRQRSAN